MPCSICSIPTAIVPPRTLSTLPPRDSTKWARLVAFSVAKLLLRALQLATGLLGVAFCSTEMPLRFPDFGPRLFDPAPIRLRLWLRSRRGSLPLGSSLGHGREQVEARGLEIAR